MPNGRINFVRRTDSAPPTSRRRYLTALAAAVSTGGCLQFTEPATTATDEQRETAQSGGASDETTTETEAARTNTSTANQSSGAAWRASANAPFVAGPVVADGTVVATSLDRHVYGFDATTGRQQWSANSETELDKGLTVVDGVAVAAGVEEQLGVAINDGSVTYRKSGFENGTREQAAAADTVYQCGIQGGLRSLDPVTGDRRWLATSEEPRVVVDHDGDTVCVGLHPTGHHGAPPWAFAGFDAATGEELWYVERNIEDANANPSVAVAGGTCLAYNGGSHHMVIDARSGEVRREVTDSRIGRLYGSTDDDIVVSRGGKFEAIDGQTGKTRVRTTVGPGTPDATHLGDGTFWFLSGTTLYRFDIDSGEAATVGDLALDGTQVGDRDGGLAVVGETAFVTTSDARIHALSLP